MSDSEEKKSDIGAKHLSNQAWHEVFENNSHIYRT